VTSFTVRPQSKPLIGIARVPGDKSVSHRALMFSALASEPTTIRGLGSGSDNRRTRRAIEQMGAQVSQHPSGAVVVSGVGVDGLRAPDEVIECGNSGTSMRLLCGLLAGQGFDAILTGDESLSRRPMRRVTGPLAQMGARIEGAGGDRPGEVYPPLAILGARLAGIDFSSPVASAQVKSAVLLAGLYADGVTRVREPARSRDHTERMLSHMGAPLRVAADNSISIDPAGWDRTLRGGRIDVPGDPSSAAFILCAALVAGVERIAVADVCVNETRTGFFDVLIEMGAMVEQEARNDSGSEPTADLVASRGAGDGLRGTVVSGELTVRAIDELPILAVVAARADGVTDFRDAAELRVKESDRITTTVAMLRSLGVSVEERDDGFSVQGMAGAPFSSARIDAAGDHRLAMSGAVAALAADGPVQIDDVDNVMTSFPRFSDVLRELGADVSITGA
jgi:3-phosphoshikimate 1-carboxyvinyltransferase